MTYLLVEDDAEVAPADRGIGELHEVSPCQHGGLLAPPHAPALRDAKGLVVPVRIRRAQALSTVAASAPTWRTVTPQRDTRHVCISKDTAVRGRYLGGADRRS